MNHGFGHQGTGGHIYQPLSALGQRVGEFYNVHVLIIYVYMYIHVNVHKVPKNNPFHL